MLLEHSRYTLESGTVEGCLADANGQMDESAGGHVVSLSAVECWILQDEVLAPEMAPVEDSPELKSTAE